MTWLFNNEPFENPEEQYYGFVYVITNLLTGKKYIGKKFFWARKTRIVKGRKKRYLAESDWKRYYGSSKYLLEEINNVGVDNFKREIIILCRSKGECAYYEAKAQFESDVLFKPDLFYNDWIICRVHRKHVQTKTDEICD